MQYLENGHFTEAEARKLLRKYGKGRSVHIVASTPLHFIAAEKPWTRERTELVPVTKAAAGVWLTKLFDVGNPGEYRVNVSVAENIIFLGGH